MDERLLQWLSGARRQRAQLRDACCSLRVITALELLEARREAAGLAADAAERAICSNACLLARALEMDGKRLFSSGADVLQALEPGEIDRLSGELAALQQRVSPSAQAGERAVEPLKKSLGHTPYERLKWRVLREMRALPTEERVRSMTDGDYLYCALQLLLDREEALLQLCPQCRSRAEEERCPGCGALSHSWGRGDNDAFDEEAFLRLAGPCGRDGEEAERRV